MVGAQHPGNPAQIDLLDAAGVESDPLQHSRNVTIQVVAASEGTPDRVQPVLQPCDPSRVRTAMLDDQQTPAGPQHPARLGHRGFRVWDGAKPIGHHDRVRDAVCQRQCLGRHRDAFDIQPRPVDHVAILVGEATGRIHRKKFRHPRAVVVAQVLAAAEVELDHHALGLRDDARAQPPRRGAAQNPGGNPLNENQHNCTSIHSGEWAQI